MVSGPDLVGASLVGLHADTNPGQPPGVEDYTSLLSSYQNQDTQATAEPHDGLADPLLSPPCVPQPLSRLQEW